MWEKIDNCTERMSVPGGWIVRSMRSSLGQHASTIAIHQIFIADTDHVWEIKKEREV